MVRKTKVLTRLELEVMRVIWDAQASLTVREVADRLNEGAARTLAYTTVQTMMRILVEKGVLRQEPGPGRAHRYASQVSQAEVTTTMVGDLVERLFDGDAKPLMAHLLDQPGVGKGELEDLKRLIEEHLDDGEGRS